MGRTKAKKKIPPMPKLGFVDQMIYMVGYLLILAAFGILFWFRFFLVEELAMEEPGAVAYEAHGSIYWFYPFYLTVVLSLFIPWQNLHSRRYPFFGKRGVKYGPPAYPRTFPLFMKNKPQYWKSPAEARMRRAAVISVVVLNLVLSLLAPLSIHGRNMLYADGAVRDYSMFNSIKREYEPEDAGEVTLRFGSYKSGKYSRGLRLVLSIDYGDRTYTFYNRSFSGADWVDELDAVLGTFNSGVIRISNADRLDAFGKRLSEENYAKLYAIFERYG